MSAISRLTGADRGGTRRTGSGAVWKRPGRSRQPLPRWLGAVIAAVAVAAPVFFVVVTTIGRQPAAVRADIRWSACQQQGAHQNLVMHDRRL